MHQQKRLGKMEQLGHIPCLLSDHVCAMSSAHIWHTVLCICYEKEKKDEGIHRRFNYQSEKIQGSKYIKLGLFL